MKNKNCLLLTEYTKSEIEYIYSASFDLIHHIYSINKIENESVKLQPYKVSGLIKNGARVARISSGELSAIGPLELVTKICRVLKKQVIV